MIEKIDHVGIAVRSIEEARKLYEAMGLQVEAIEEVPHEGVRVAMIPCGETRIELLEPLSRGLARREVPGEARPRHPPSLPGERRRAERRRPAARGRLPGAPPRAHPRRRRLLGAVRPPEEHRRRAAGAVRRRARRRRARRAMIRPGSLVIVHLINPTEKFWGILQELGVAGRDAARHQRLELRRLDGPGRPPRAIRRWASRRCSSPSSGSSGSSSTRRSARSRATASASRSASACPSSGIWGWRRGREEEESRERGALLSGRPADLPLELHVPDEEGRSRRPSWRPGRPPSPG